MLEFGRGASESYMSLFPPLLTPAVWESKGNVPALTRLLAAYATKSPQTVSASLNPVLGVFQKLISSKSNDVYGFQLLTALLESLGPEAMKDSIQPAFNVLLMRLQTGKTIRYTRHFSLFLAYFAGKHGDAALAAVLDGIQPGLRAMVVKQVWLQCVLKESMFNRSDTKTMVVGLTAVMRGQGQEWPTVAVAVLKLLKDSVMAGDKDLKDDAPAEVEVTFDSHFSKLHHAAKKATDYFPQTPDVAAPFAALLGEMGAGAGAAGAIRDEIGKVQGWDVGEGEKVMQQLIQRYGVRLGSQTRPNAVKGQ